jgi:hypothetical protein
MKKSAMAAVLFFGGLQALSPLAHASAAVVDAFELNFDTEARLDHFESFAYFASNPKAARFNPNGSGVDLSLSFRDEQQRPIQVMIENVPGLVAMKNAVVFGDPQGQSIVCAHHSYWVEGGVQIAGSVIGILTAPAASAILTTGPSLSSLLSKPAYNFNDLTHCELVINAIEPHGSGSRVSAKLVVFQPNN